MRAVWPGALWGQKDKDVRISVLSSLKARGKLGLERGSLGTGMDGEGPVLVVDCPKLLPDTQPPTSPVNGLQGKSSARGNFLLL